MYDTHIYALRQVRGKHKAELQLVPPSTISLHTDETYDMVRRQENLMYGYSKSEHEALMEANNSQGIHDHALGVLDYLEAKMVEMQSIDEQDIKCHKYRRTRLTAMECYATVDCGLTPNDEAARAQGGEKKSLTQASEDEIRGARRLGKL